MSNQNPYGGGNGGGYGPPPPPSQQHPQHYQHPQQGYYPPPQQPMVYVQQNTVQQRVGFNHTPHIIISFVTCGAWLPIYLLIWALSGR